MNMKTLSLKKLFLLSVLFTLALFLLCLSLRTAFAEEAKKDDKQIVVTDIVVLQSREELKAKQEAARAKFLKEVEESPYELLEVTQAVNGGTGFITELYPKFTKTLKTPQNQNRVLVFLMGDKELKTYITQGEDAFEKEFLREHEEVLQAIVVQGVYKKDDTENDVPIAIYVKTRSLEMSM